VSIVIRSILFNVLFYANLFVYFIIAIPTFLLNRHGIIAVTRSWARSSNRLLRWICGIKIEYRGLDKIPPGGVLIASKHQSFWETFALIVVLPDPAYILKRELMWIPFFGWYAWKGEMIPVDRGARSQALSAMTAHAKVALAEGRQIIIFPEGTRRTPGAEPAYKWGVAHLYDATGAPCVPVALNSGLFWPRRSYRRLPGTIRVEVLDPILPGLEKEAFFARLQDAVEAATARLVAEGERELAVQGYKPTESERETVARS
jgi:1-acyl-sn-glycerol-3-phosphate acyltransferase